MFSKKSWLLMACLLLFLQSACAATPYDSIYDVFGIYSLNNTADVNISLQVRSCDDAACSGKSFIGPDGTASTWFTTAFTNNAISWDLNAISNNQYFQYTSHFVSYDGNYSPKLFDTNVVYNSGPSDVNLDIGNNDTNEWSWAGAFASSTTVNDSNTSPTFSSALNTALAAGGGCGCTGCTYHDSNNYCTIPFILSSLTAGKISASNISIQYDSLALNIDVTDQAGSPIENALVEIFTPTGSGTAWKSDYTNAQGQVSFATINSKKYDIKSSKTGYSSNTYYTNVDANGSYDLNMTSLIDYIHVYTYNAAGNPLQGKIVELYWDSNGSLADTNTTNALGHASFFRQVDYFDVKVDPSGWNYIYDAIQPPTTKSLYELLVYVKDQKDVNVGSAKVWVYEAGTAVSWNIDSNASGYSSFGLENDVNYDISAYKQGVFSRLLRQSVPNTVNVTLDLNVYQSLSQNIADLNTTMQQLCELYPNSKLCQYLSDINATVADINANTWLSAADVWNYATRALTDCNQADMWTYLRDINLTVVDINGNAWLSAADVWGYANRTLTDYNMATLPEYIWNFSTRTLTDYNQTAMFGYLNDINATVIDINGNTWITASDVWNYANKVLTDYNQSQMWSYLTDINAVNYDINANVWVSASDVWSYAQRGLTDYNQSTMLLYLQDINVTVKDINGNTWISAQDVWNYSVRTLTDYNQSTVFAYLADINAFSHDTNETTANIWLSQQQNFKVILSDFGKIANGSTYRAKLGVFDFNGSPKDADSTPTMTLYDPVRNVTVQNVDLNHDETGVYSYSFITTSSHTAGQWEAVASAVVNGSTVKPSDWWELTGNPPEVTINSITDATVPSITADVTITNEGIGSQEYQYEYCIVSEQTNQCGGSDDEDYASGAKLIQAGETWNTSLNLTVSETGTYWFKVKVYYGSETSAASKQFTATAAPTEPTPSPGGPSGGGGPSGLVTLPGAVGKISITEFPSEMVVKQGDFEFFLVKVKNVGEGNLTDLSLSIDGLFLDWYSVEQDKTALTPNEEASFVIKIMVPLNAELKDHLVKFKVSSSEDSKEAESVLRVLEKALVEIRFSDVSISRMMVEGTGEIDITLFNNSLEDLNLNISLLTPLDWQIEEKEFDLLLKAGQQRKIKFKVNTSYRSGVQDLVLTVKSKDGIIFAGVGEDKLFKDLLVIVHAPEKPFVMIPFLPVPIEWIGIAVLAIALLALMVFLVKRRKGLHQKMRLLKAKAEKKLRPEAKEAFEIKNIEVVGETFSVVVQARDKEGEEVFTFELKELGDSLTWKKRIENIIVSREKAEKMAIEEERKKEAEGKEKAMIAEAKEKAKAGEKLKEAEEIEGKESGGAEIVKEVKVKTAVPKEEKMLVLEEKLEALEKKVAEQEKELEELRKQTPKSKKQLLKEKEELQENLEALKEMHSKELVSERAFSESKKAVEEKLAEIEKGLKTKQELVKEKKDLEKALKQLEKMHSKGLLPDKAFEESKKKIQEKLVEITQVVGKGRKK